MRNIVPDALSMRHLSIPARGFRRFDDKGADRSVDVVLNWRWRWLIVVVGGG